MNRDRSRGVQAPAQTPPQAWEWELRRRRPRKPQSASVCAVTPRRRTVFRQRTGALTLTQFSQHPRCFRGGKPPPSPSALLLDAPAQTVPPPPIPHRPAPALPAPRRSSSPSPQRLACPSSSPSSAISLSPSFFHGDGDLEPLPALTAGTPPPSLPLRPRPSPLPPVCPQCCPAGSRARAGSGHLLILSQRDGVTPTGLRAGAGSPRMASDSSRHGSPGTGTVVGQGATGRSWASGSHLGLAGD